MGDVTPSIIKARDAYTALDPEYRKALEAFTAYDHRVALWHGITDVEATAAQIVESVEDARRRFADDIYDWMEWVDDRRAAWVAWGGGRAEDRPGYHYGPEIAYHNGLYIRRDTPGEAVHGLVDGAGEVRFAADDDRVAEEIRRLVRGTSSVYVDPSAVRTLADVAGPEGAPPPEVRWAAHVDWHAGSYVWQNEVAPPLRPRPAGEEALAGLGLDVLTRPPETDPATAAVRIAGKLTGRDNPDRKEYRIQRVRKGGDGYPKKLLEAIGYRMALSPTQVRRLLKERGYELPLDLRHTLVKHSR